MKKKWHDKLTPHEAKTLARYFLGGVDAVRCKEFSATTQTIGALFKKGYLDTHGLTGAGYLRGKELADSGLV